MVYAKALQNCGRVGTIAALGLLSMACPQGEAGQCVVDQDCQGRAEVCDTYNSICVPEEADLSSTEYPAPSTFSGKAVPFFRGEVCTVHEVESGAAIPVSINPCLHECVNRRSHHFKHFFNCVGSTCDAFVVMWVTADSAGECPDDAFAKFTHDCTYGDPVQLSISTNLDSGPISGTMELEIPFLSNDDIEAIAGGRDGNAQMRALIEQYPQERGRVVGGRTISILPGNPAPPDNCQGGACDCFAIGF